jgi:hypothetical protein
MIRYMASACSGSQTSRGNERRIQHPSRHCLEDGTQDLGRSMTMSECFKVPRRVFGGCRPRT